MLFFLAIVAIVFASLVPNDRVDIRGWNDKFWHAVAYFGASALAVVSFPGRRERIVWLVFLVVLGGLLELGQQYVGRTTSLGDMVANLTGVMSASVALWWLPTWASVGSS